MSSASTDTVLSNQELAKQIQSLLSSSPPFIDDNSIKVLVRFYSFLTALAVLTILLVRINSYNLQL